MYFYYFQKSKNVMFSDYLFICVFLLFEPFTGQGMISINGLDEDKIRGTVKNNSGAPSPQ